MPTNRSKISVNRTLLILLGIILACLLTLNARSFYSAETLSLPKKTPGEAIDKKAPAELIGKISSASFHNFVEKVSTLK